MDFLNLVIGWPWDGVGWSGSPQSSAGQTWPGLVLAQFAEIPCFSHVRTIVVCFLRNHSEHPKTIPATKNDVRPPGGASPRGCSKLLEIARNSAPGGAYSGPPSAEFEIISFEELACSRARRPHSGIWPLHFEPARNCSKLLEIARNSGAGRA